MNLNTTKNKALLSLLLLIPAPSIGVIAGMILWPDTLLGTGIFTLSKLWLLTLPLLWHTLVDKSRISFSPLRKGGLWLAFISGTAISALIVTAYFLFWRFFFDEYGLTVKIVSIGLDNPTIYICAALYWICVNSVLEEYVWRWFVTKQCSKLTYTCISAILSALFFTLHHTIAMSTFMWPETNAICSAGIFAGGVIWSWMYIKYKSIWPGFISHAIVDLAIFGLGYLILFHPIVFLNISKLIH